MQLITKSNRKDRHDARTLARLARIDPELLGPVRHRSAQAQIHLTVIRARAELVSARTAHGHCISASMSKPLRKPRRSDREPGYTIIIRHSGCTKIQPRCTRRCVANRPSWKSTFPEFLLACWPAGVVRYDVDFTARACTYFGCDGEKYIEDYPEVAID